MENSSEQSTGLIQNDSEPVKNYLVLHIEKEGIFVCNTGSRFLRAAPEIISYEEAVQFADRMKRSFGSNNYRIVKLTEIPGG